MSVPGCIRLPEEEFSKVVDTLISDYKIKDMVTKAIASPLTDSEKYPRQRKEEEAQIINVLAKMV
jgi:hypothetical protein